MSTQKQLRVNMICAFMRYHMTSGTYGPLPYAGIRGPQTKDGGFYKRVLNHVHDTFGSTIGSGKIDQAKTAAVEIDGAEVLKPGRTVKPPKAKTYATDCPSNATEAELKTVARYRMKSDYELVQFLRKNFGLLTHRMDVTRGIIRAYDNRGSLVGKQRFALVMAISKEVL